jgi:adenosine deaminase
MKEDVDLEHLSPYYKLACESVHAGSKGTLDRLGIIRHEDIEQPGVLLSGPSNAGLNLPGQLTAISLAQVTTNLLTIHLNSPYLADMQGMQMLVDDIEQEFADASEALEQDDREATRKWANQDIVDIALNQIDRSDLFSEDFFEGYTDFNSLEEFEDALSVGLDNVKDGDSVNPDVDEVVQEHSDFDSFRDLVDTAMEIYVRRNVDLSEFDIDGDPSPDEQQSE